VLIRSNARALGSYSCRGDVTMLRPPARASRALQELQARLGKSTGRADRLQVSAVATGPRPASKGDDAIQDLGGGMMGGDTGMFTNTSAEVRRIVPVAGDRKTIKIVYVVLEAQYQSSISAAVNNINKTNGDVCVEVRFSPPLPPLSLTASAWRQRSAALPPSLQLPALSCCCYLSPLPTL
jgi:hypothetical protein